MELTVATARAKRSCAERGYVDDPFAAYFVAAGQDRVDPSINRGYYARSEAIEYLVRSFAKGCAGNGQIVSLGAGFETSFWRLEDLGLVHFEVDSEAVVAAKASIVTKTASLRRALGAEVVADANGLRGGRYRLISCDLRDPAALGSRLAAAGFASTRPTIVVAECVLAYLEAEESTAVAAWAADLPCSLFVDYDVMAPDDAFARIMLANFKRRGWPLLSATRFKTLGDHSDRLKTLAFEAVAVADMANVCSRLVLASPVERVRVANLEIFDDPDEFNLIMEHYCLGLAANGPAALAVLAAFRDALAADPLPRSISPETPTG